LKENGRQTKSLYATCMQHSTTWKLRPSIRRCSTNKQRVASPKRSRQLALSGCLWTLLSPLSSLHTQTIPALFLFPSPHCKERGASTVLSYTILLTLSTSTCLLCFRDYSIHEFPHQHRKRDHEREKEPAQERVSVLLLQEPTTMHSPPFDSTRDQYHSSDMAQV